MGSLSRIVGQHLKLPARSPNVSLLASRLSLRRNLGPKLRSTMVAGWWRSFSSQSSGLLLDLPQYRQMRETLAGRKGDLGVLESAGLCILDMENLRVDTAILNLNMLSYSGNYKEIQTLRAAGVIKSGKYTNVHNELIRSSFHDLSLRIEADQKTFKAELFSPGRRNLSVLLQRNLVGFYLLQELEDWSQRLPVEVVARLGTLLSSGVFSRQEDEAILAWVEEHGLVDWTELAAELGRNYERAGDSVMNHHQVLQDRQENKRLGSFSMEELGVVIREVIRQKPSALEDTKHGDINWKPIAESLNRPDINVYQVFIKTIHPTLRRHLAASLEQDVRAELVQQVGREGWTYSVQMDFSLLEDLPQFKGHTSHSLQNLYNGLMTGVLYKRPALKSKREVTVEDVEEYWRNSPRQTKRKSQVAREEGMVEAYWAVMRELNTVKRNTE